MTDMLATLRARLATTIDTAIGDGPWQPEAVVDAIVAEFGLKVECTVWLDQPQHRWVSDWIAGGFDNHLL